MQNTLISINSVLDELIQITYQDIEDIKKANHQQLFDRNSQKELLLSKFVQLKSNIDSTLAQRDSSSQTLVKAEEELLLDEFKQKLQTFYKLHKKFEKMAFSVTNFYNNLVHKITGARPDIGYNMSSTPYSSFSLKG